MLHIIKKQCKSFDEFVKKYPKCTYSDLHNYDGDSNGLINEKRNIYDELKSSLNKEQYGLCCYCCCKIEILESFKNSIEHIAPISLYPQESMKYNNMLLSCSSTNSCNHKKGGKFDPNSFISPLDENCESHFDFNIYTGEIVPRDENDSRAKYTIELLNLNSTNLKNSRKQTINKLNEQMKYYGEKKKELYNDYVNKHMQFSDIVKYAIYVFNL